ncbi:MAG: vWA domain-containing protein [Oceanobacter sp.]
MESLHGYKAGKTSPNRSIISTLVLSGLTVLGVLISGCVPESGEETGDSSSTASTSSGSYAGEETSTTGTTSSSEDYSSVDGSVATDSGDSVATGTDSAVSVLDSDDTFFDEETEAVITSDDSEVTDVVEDGYQTGSLTAGDIDDNLNYRQFLDYYSGLLQEDSSGVFPAPNLGTRISVRVVNAENMAISNAPLQITTTSGDLLYESQTDALGRFYFFPWLDLTSEQRDGLTDIIVTATDPQDVSQTVSSTEALDESSVDLRLLDSDSNLVDALEWVLVIDATGSMSDELDYLTAEFQAIITDLRLLHSSIPMKFGLVMYRDSGDSFVVRTHAFTDSVDTMTSQLQLYSASGGGDYPEAMDQALDAALGFQWSDGNQARVIMLAADAPPHDVALERTFNLALEARQRGINIFPLAASGVGDLAENLMRLMALITNGSYMFLTDDSGYGNSHSEPTVPCYIVTRLDQLITRRIDSLLSGQRVEPSEGNILRTSGSYEAGVCGEQE